METNERETVLIKQNYFYNCLSCYLTVIGSWGVMRDKRLRELYTALKDYVDSLVEVPKGMEMVDEYYVLECAVVEESTE